MWFAFETRISSGGLTAYPGGDRDRWEHALFGGAYHVADVMPRDCPKYGGLNVVNYLNGACPRFGSCHLRLTAGLRDRATLLYGDSAYAQGEVGTDDSFEVILAPLLEDLAAGHGALGRPTLTLNSLLTGAIHGDLKAGRGQFAPVVSNALGVYIEAPIHGRLALAGDVEAVVIDRAFAKTRSADSLIAAADSYGLRVEWTPAITLELRDVPRTSPRETEQPPMRWELLLDDSRAYELAATVIDRFGNVSQLDAANIGAAGIDVLRRTDRWRTLSTPSGALVQLKDLWLMLVALGNPTV